MPRTRTKLKHLMLRKGTYYLKIAIPKDIQLATGTGRYKVGEKKIESLRTDDLSTAIRLRDARLEAIQKEWAEIRLKASKVKGIVQQQAVQDYEQTTA